MSLVIVYSSVSLVLVGDNSLVQPLRILTSLSFTFMLIFIHNTLFLSAMKEHGNYYYCLKNLLACMCPKIVWIVI